MRWLLLGLMLLFAVPALRKKVNWGGNVNNIRPHSYH